MTNPFCLPFLGALLVMAALPHSASLSKIESEIARNVDARNGEALALLERVVNINSGTMNFAGVREVGAIFRAELDGLGFTTRWVDGDPFQRAGHLVAEKRGDTAVGGHIEGRRILLIGHLDTVFEKESAFQRFQSLPGDKARGPGVIDMKGGDVIIVHALKALKSAGLLDRMNVAVVLMGDEEESGQPLSLARKDLVEIAQRSDIAIGFEDGPGRPENAVIARRGSTGWVLKVSGTPAHSSQIFRSDVGAGAIYETARILDEFYRKLSGEPYLTFNPGVIVGGTSVEFDAVQDRGAASGKGNVVAREAAVSGDLRTLSPEQLERAQARMREIVASHLPHTDASITFDDGYPPMAPTEGNQRLLALYDQASRDLGFGPVKANDPSTAGAADVAFAAGRVKMAIDGVGLMGTDDHTEKETADLKTLPSQTKRAALLLYRLTNK